MKQSTIFIYISVLALCMVSCAPAGYEAHEFGFWGGLWQGAIFGFSLIGKILSEALHYFNSNWGDWDIGMYAENNTGFTYWAGYVIGLFMYGIPSVFGSRK